MIALLSAVQPIAAQEGAHRAGLVVVHGDGRVVTRCVAFDEPQISGSALLARSGLTVVSTTGPLGQTICSLNGEGCPASSCWCECAGTPCIYWVYHNQQPDGSWAYANLGAAQRVVTDGDVDAWVWGEITQSPPAIGFEAICGAGAPPEAPPTPTPQPAADPSATAVASPVAPTPTLAPTLTPAPTSEPAPPTPTAPVTATRTTPVVPSPTPVSTEPAPVPTASPEVEDTPAAVTITASPTPAASAPTATAPSPAAAPSEGASTQYLAFALAFGAVALAFILLTRRSGD